MKRIFSFFVVCMTAVSLAACGNSEAANGETANEEKTANAAEESQQDQVEETSADTGSESGKSLVVYFSATGNTKAAAEIMAKMQGADIYEIIPEEPYTDEDLNYNDRLTRATVEQNDENARPAISSKIDNLGDYNVIYVGYPIWWGDMPRILYTFFDTYDFSGKTIAPFCTSGGSGLSGTPGAIEELEPDADVLEGLQISGSSASDAEDDIAEWISSIGL